MKNKNLLFGRVIKIQNLYLIAIYLLVVGVFLLPKNEVLASEITINKIIELTNQERIKNNFEPLSINQKLSEAASNKVNNLIENQYFSHTSPEGKNFALWIKEVNYRYVYAGENLAMDFISAEGVIKAWMNSESHKKNLLSPLYDETGVAISAGIFKGQPTIIITQLFGREKKSKDNEELTLTNFNGIINNNKSNIIFPSLIQRNTGDIVYTTYGINNIKLSAVTILDNAPLKKRFVAKNRDVKPIVAGAMTSSDQNKHFELNKYFYFYSSLILLILVGYILIQLLKQSQNFYIYK